MLALGLDAGHPLPFVVHQLACVQSIIDRLLNEVGEDTVG